MMVENFLKLNNYLNEAKRDERANFKKTAEREQVLAKGTERIQFTVIRAEYVKTLQNELKKTAF